MMLARWFRHFDSGEPGESISLENRLKRAHSRFTLWCEASNSTAHLRGFTKDFMHLARVDGFAYTNSKGSDTILLLKWLRLELTLAQRRLHDNGVQRLAQAACQMCDASVEMFRVVYKHGLWLPRTCMRYLRDQIITVTRGYNFVAVQCLNHGFPGFGMKTTLHALQHFAVDIDLCLQAKVAFMVSPLLNDCSQCEDFIGRTARVARATHSKLTALRCLQRHMVKTKLLLKRNLTVLKPHCKSSGRGSPKKEQQSRCHKNASARTLHSGLSTLYW